MSFPKFSHKYPYINNFYLLEVDPLKLNVYLELPASNEMYILQNLECLLD